ncbi:MAG TPA: hypothetical protein VK470_00870, partial [Bacteroidota bacterium]|nr:hypothetical protein [Bacteroidota bacterium]
WQKGEIKAFYSEATEIVRRYFEGRYGVMALEMTTDEVLDQLVEFKLSREMMDEIRAFLADADLVKFAKVIPSISDNEHVIPVALEIVEKTRPVAQPNVPHVQVVDVAPTGAAVVETDNSTGRQAKGPGATTTAGSGTKTAGADSSAGRGTKTVNGDSSTGSGMKGADADV